jgi:hypothetical protein
MYTVQVSPSLTINVPFVYMGWGNPERGPFEGVGPEIETFFGPETTTSAASAIWAQKVEISGPTPSNGPRNGFPRIQIICPAPYKKGIFVIL